jgi:hypothetical protein
MSFTTAPDAAVPHLDVNADMGNFVWAVCQMPPGRSYMAEGTTCSWSEYLRFWSHVTGARARYQQITLQQMVDAVPDKEFGREIADMFSYSSGPGYDGGDASLLKAADIEKVRCNLPSRPTVDEFDIIGWHPVPNDDARELDEGGRLVCGFRVRGDSQMLQPNF